ncbi:mitochondrial fission 1 protein-like [Uloborus diversus]|uniref:mitochondrial fission 1 protein-like n=1 Tax=Uloborus diversus TaxID=327109 RepID=UPI0024095468|nr:mitochondrial fission 1 protein-like [Uloborus diversus]XP_054723942.1 mitochondrial fission 1 protein-like [Uloborus diversus]
MATEARSLVLPIEDMKTLLNHNVPVEDRATYQLQYEAEVASNNIDFQTKFQYAFCLIHSSNRNDIKKGALMFEEIFKEGNEEIKRDSLFYLAVAETKQKNYCSAQKYAKAFLSVEPTNIQAQQLDVYIQKQLKKDGLTGMALFGAATIFGGAAAIVVGSLAVGAALGYSLVKRKGQ